MEKIKKNEWWLLAGFLAYSGAVSYLSHQKGKNDCQKAHESSLVNNKKTLENHEAKLDSIRNESDADAYRRFKQDSSPR